MVSTHQNGYGFTVHVEKQSLQHPRGRNAQKRGHLFHRVPARRGYQKGEKVTVDLNGIEVSCDIEDVSDNSDRLKVILRCRDYYKNFAKIRKMDVKVMSSRSAGLVISNECIFTKKGRPGVYVKTKTGDFVFKPVYVEAIEDQP